MEKVTSFCIIGGGFRSEFYLRIAKEMPGRFRVSGMVVRDPVRSEEIERVWNVKTYGDLDELLAREQPDFAVVSVARSACPGYLFALADRGIPALAETPPAPDLEGLLALHELTRRGAKIQVAEQYRFQPLHAARLALIGAGRLGTVSEAYVSAAHGYHGVNLLRRYLSFGFGPVNIRAMRFEAPLTGGPSRSGPPTEETVVTSRRDLAWIDFGGKLGVFDFASEQYRSWIRSNYVSIRGDRGEIVDERAHVLADYSTPLHLNLKRINKGENGNLEGHFLEGIMAGEQWIYRNPFAPHRLFDDEIAVAEALDRMAGYAAGGPEFYGLPEASQDHYLSLMIERAIATGESVVTEVQPWAR